MQSRDQRARDIQHQIGAILYRAWDPLAVNAEPLARDEYAPYVAGVYRILASGGSADQLARHLSRIEAEQMGLAHSHPQRLIRVVEELRRLDIRLEVPGAPDTSGRTQ